MAADWKAIKTEYITTNTSYRKLAQKYGVGASTLFERASKERWVEAKEQHQSKTMAKTLNAIGNQQANRAARLQTVADKLLCKIEDAGTAGWPWRYDANQAEFHCVGDERTGRRTGGGIE